MDTSNGDEFSYFQYYCSFVIQSAFGDLSAKELKRFRKSVLKQERIEDQFKLILNNALIESELKKFSDNLTFATKKCSSTAAAKLRCGHEAFDVHNYEEALAVYSESILYLPFPNKNEADELWSQCFLHRALVYFRLQLYSYCVADFDEAINHTADNRQKVLLICFKAYALKLAKSSDHSVHDELDISLKSTNDRLYCASDHLELKVTAEKGRTLISKKRVETGTLLVIQPPVVAWLRPSFWNEYCNHCLQPLNNRCLPCRNCINVRYCSWKCSESAWNSYHKVECKLSSTLKNLVFGTLGLRIMIIYGVENVMNCYKKNETVDWTKAKMDNDLQTVMSLVHEMNVKDEKFEFEVLIGTALMTKIAENLGLIDSCSAYLLRFCSALKLCIFKVLLNCFYIYDERLKMNGEIVTFDSDYKDVGFSVYSSASMFSHSCDCNANRFFFGSQIYVYSNRCIETSEEVTVDYGADIYRNSFRYRQVYLKNSFGFECCCTACENLVENVHFSVICPHCEGSVIMNRLNEKDCSNHCLSCGSNDIKVQNAAKKIEEGDKYFRKAEKRCKASDSVKAKTYLKKCLNAYKEAYFAKVPLKDVYILLSTCYFNESRYSRAFDNCMEALKCIETIYGKHSFDYVDQLLNLIDIAIHENDEQRQYLKRSNLDYVKTYFEEAMQLLAVLKQRDLKLAHKRQLRFFPVIEAIAKKLNYSKPLVSIG